ncbi:bifunctional folylpolyglutamate synthase/dihydrofolate synthase [Anaeromicropila herbilytica]|uniref:tetrahydrofolate synthase n=1 Tax=Anaeromicropila herbilytica TaxID=2785025 RepID=A0A7R7IC32_9FIRM|nr:folylpolyglutamate synthase/dihydrofolate synthase family protein [Anaeromicropila herbilytica]BCN30303.1 bifunctional folylpolyglutamate synthase/dihydrofolate synthase [Anaeromicropila herbilytica]
MQNMTYEEALEYLKDTEKYGSVLGLDNIRGLLNMLGNPQNDLKFIHLAGTNGKGSTAAYIASILAESGYKVGRYISPVIFDYLERIQISEKVENEVQNSYITREAVSHYVSLLKEANDKMLAKGLHHPTTFEIETAMMFLYLRDEKCDIVVLETGMGGRLDATNVIETAVLSVITSISMDHMQFLGDTIEKITYEKAGIIKKEVPVVSYDQVPAARGVLKNRCEELSCNLRLADFTELKDVEHGLSGIKFSYKNYKNLKIKLIGENQVKNAATAIETIERLKLEGYTITEESVRKGLSQTVWRGRFEILHESPLFIVDGAHNEDAAISLRKSMELYLKDKHVTFIIGVFADKEYEKVIQITSSFADTIYTIDTDNKRALPSNQLAEVIRKYHKNVVDAKSVNVAIRKAMEEVAEDEVIIAFGSLSFLNQIYDYFHIII